MSRVLLPSGFQGFRLPLSMCVALCLLPPPACWAEDPLFAGLSALPDAPVPQQEAPAQTLEITILDGEGALNNIRQRTAREPIVQVEDHNHKPVAGALILFTIHDGASGAGGSFAGASTLSAVTDANGRAQGHGFTPNSSAGRFTITVTATLGAIVVTAIIHQENGLGSASGNANTEPTVKPKFHIIPKNPIVRVVIGEAILAGVIATVVVLTSGNGGTLVTAGPGSVGAP